jgi:class 3 adenylate cyclase
VVVPKFDNGISWLGLVSSEISQAIIAPIRKAVDRVLATVLFTDIVSSTEKAAALGDRRWRDLLDNHHATIRRNLRAFAVMRSKRPATAFLPPLTVQLAASAVPALLPMKSGHLASKSAPDCIRASAK